MSTGAHRTLLRLAVLVLVFAVLGLPVNDLYRYSLFALATLVVFTATISTRSARWLGAAALTLAVLAQHLFFAAPRIEEGHNVFLIDRPGGALEQGLPPDVFRVMAERFNAAHPPQRRCDLADPLCWRNGISRRVFAFAADGAFDGHAYSRRVSGIDFQSAIWLRLGVLNDLSLNFVGKDGDVERVRRDKRSLAIFARWQNKLPFFLMYRFSPAFAGSELCWRGSVLWEAGERFELIEHRDRGCRTVRADDSGRRIFAFAIGPDADLAMTLNANGTVKAWRALDAATATIGVLGILMLLARWRPARLRLPLLLMTPALIVIVIVDATFIGGYRPLDGGDDGLIFSGFARQMLEHLMRGDIMGALRGVEPVFFFTPGFRYFRMAEYLVFGDSFLGYLTLMLVAPLVVFALGRRFLGDNWALVFTLGFVATPAGVLFGTSYIHYAVWSARGFADPLAATLFLTSLLLLAGRGPAFGTRAAPAFWGALTMALAVIVRPNLAPGSAMLLGGIGLAALSQGQVKRLAALCLGFSAIFFTLWHNWHFGGKLIPLSDNVQAQNIYMVPPSVYWHLIGDLARLNFTSENLARVRDQFAVWLSGPSELRILIPVHVAGLALLVRIALASRFEPMLRLTALAALALTSLAFVYLPALRYHLVIWLLTALVTAAWLRAEGLAWIDRVWPGWRTRVAQSAFGVMLLRGFEALRRFAGFDSRAVSRG